MLINKINRIIQEIININYSAISEKCVTNNKLRGKNKKEKTHYGIIKEISQILRKQGYACYEEKEIDYIYDEQERHGYIDIFAYNPTGNSINIEFDNGNTGRKNSILKLAKCKSKIIFIIVKGKQTNKLHDFIRRQKKFLNKMPLWKELYYIQLTPKQANKIKLPINDV